MKTQYTDVVAEYLRELDQRLAGLPVLQRRELLADLAAHIETERVERNLRGEAELIEVLERLGSPEVVARAAYEEAGPLSPPPVAGPPMPPPPQLRRERSPWAFLAIGAALVGLLLVMALCAGLFWATRSGSEAPAVGPTVVAPSPARTGLPADEAPTPPEPARSR